MYKLFYNSNFPVTALRPVLCLEECFAQASCGNVDEQKRLVRVNWMIQDLHYNPIQKPFLVDGSFNIITGDTRMMALQFHPKITHVPVLMTSTVAPFDWEEIEDKTQLGKLLNILPEDILTNWDWHDKKLDWIEFAYAHTEHHMHDVQQRERMILNYLDKYPGTIFDQDWVCSKIDWSLYDH